MKKTFLVVAMLLALGAVVALPVFSAEWMDKTQVAAVDKVLASMPADFYQIDPAAAQQQLEATKPFLLDVREAKEMSKGKIAGAVNIPIRDLPKMIAKLPESKTAPIVTYCQIGYRGGMSVMVLRMFGYTNVRTIRGGLDGWEKAGLPVADKS